MPPDLGVTDFGLLPRDRYPLVAVLTLANPETRDNYNIVSSSLFFIICLMGQDEVHYSVVFLGGQCDSAARS